MNDNSRNVTCIIPPRTMRNATCNSGHQNLNDTLPTAVPYVPQGMNAQVPLQQQVVEIPAHLVERGKELAKKLRANHPKWKPEKVQRKVAEALKVKLV